MELGAKGRVGTGTVDRVREPEEKGRGLVVVASTIESTLGSGGRATDNVASHGVSPFPESSMVSTESALLISEACCTIW